MLGLAPGVRAWNLHGYASTPVPGCLQCGCLWCRLGRHDCFLPSLPHRAHRTPTSHQVPTAMKLKDISRTATFAWDPSSIAAPYLVTGDAAGALDESFSNESHLELWAPKLYDPENAQGYGLGGKDQPGPQGKVTVSSRYVNMVI